MKNVKIELKNFPADAPPTAHEIAEYIGYVQSQVGKPLIKLIITYSSKDNCVDLHYVACDEKFERIRRITGYLTGTLDTWNDAKQAEERERVKHGTEMGGVG